VAEVGGAEKNTLRRLINSAADKAEAYFALRFGGSSLMARGRRARAGEMAEFGVSAQTAAHAVLLGVRSFRLVADDSPRWGRG
jgi:hypothetical protein